MQMLPDALAKKFREFGGEIRLSCPVKKIRINSNKVTGIVTEQDGPVASAYVISNCDARQTFLELLGKENVHDDVFLNNLNTMHPSLSIFILYLGLAKPFEKMPQPGVNTWLLTNYDLDDTYLLRNKVNLGSACAMARVTPDKKTILAFANVPFKNKHYWIDNKERLMNSFIDKIEESIIPGLSGHIIYREAATPHTLHRYTLNYEGAAYGWACTPSQVGLPGFRKPSFIQGLYLTCHWTTQGLGIPGVFYIGQDTARLILKRDKRQNQHSGACCVG
jgi:phytoene dehydrogenase-like protein